MRLKKNIIEASYFILFFAGFVLLIIIAGLIYRKLPEITPLIFLLAILVSIVVVFNPKLFISPKMKYNIVLGCLGAVFFGNMLYYEKYSMAESSICDIFFEGRVYNKEVETETDEGRPDTETKYYFKPANKSAKIGKQFIDFALIELSFCSIIFPLYLLRKTGYFEK